MEFGSFMEFHTRPGLTQSDAFNEGFTHIEIAESLGLDGVWMAESHFNPQRSVLSAPLVLGAAIAGRTSTIKIGTAVHVIPLGNPIRMAEEAATLDQVSQGRFEYGVGRSGFPGSYEGYGMAYGESRARFYEYLEIIRGAWMSDSFSYEGEWKDDRMHGAGTATFQDGTVYEGQFVAGKREGMGTIKYRNGTVYRGEFRDNEPWGQGTVEF